MFNDKIVFFGNRDLGLRILKFLISAGDIPRVVFLHPRGSSRWADELWELAGTTGAVVLSSDQFEGGVALNAVASLRPTIGVSAFFGHLLRREMLALFPRGVVNFHGSFLPWNRGRDPNAWALYNRTPAGGTIHLMDEGVDTGPILLQREVVPTPDMDAADLYRQTVDVLVSLFEEHWPLLKTGSIDARSQGPSYSAHRRRDFERLRQLDLGQSMTLAGAIKLLQACAVDENTSAEFVQDGTRYSVRVKVAVVSGVPEEG